MKRVNQEDEESLYERSFKAATLVTNALLYSVTGKPFRMESESQALLLGLEESGKTTLLYKLKLGEHKITTAPTFGFNEERLAVKSKPRRGEPYYLEEKLIVTDVGGQINIRPLWRHMIRGSLERVIWVIDSAAGRENHAESREELILFMKNNERVKELATSVTIVCNKQDIVGCATRDDLKTLFALEKLEPFQGMDIRWVACSVRDMSYQHLWSLIISK